MASVRGSIKTTTQPTQPTQPVPAVSEASAFDEDGLPLNPAQLRLPSGEVRERPRLRSWEGDAASLQRAQAAFDAEDKTPEREERRRTRRAAVAAQ